MQTEKSTSDKKSDGEFEGVCQLLTEAITVCASLLEEPNVAESNSPRGSKSGEINSDAHDKDASSSKHAKRVMKKLAFLDSSIACTEASFAGMIEDLSTFLKLRNDAIVESQERSSKYTVDTRVMPSDFEFILSTRWGAEVDAGPLRRLCEHLRTEASIEKFFETASSNEETFSAACDLIDSVSETSTKIAFSRSAR